MTLASRDNDQPELESDIEVVEEDTALLNLLFGTYADILFVLLPFVVVGLFRAWHDGFQTVLLNESISMAAAVLGGLAVVKFIIGLMSDPRMLQHKERMVFLIAGTVFLVLVPGLLFAILIMLSNPVPHFVMFVQPLLVIMGIMAYSGAVTFTHRTLKDAEDGRESEAKPH